MKCEPHPSGYRCPICFPDPFDVAPIEDGHGDCEGGRCDKCDETAAQARMWDEVPL